MDSCITRRGFLRLAAAGAAGCMLPRSLWSQSRPAGSRPVNVLFIAVDDLRPELGCYGVPRVISPNIDRLAARGTVFDRVYCQQAVCSPSRTSLLTGCRPDTTKVYDLVTHFRTNLPDVVALPQHFKNHGYDSRGFSKIYHDGLDDVASWSVPHWSPKPGHGSYLDPRNKEIYNQRLAEAKARGPDKTGKIRASGPAVECADVPDNAYADGKTADKVIETLREVAAGGKPFFLAAGFYRPHLPFVAPKRYWDLYKRQDIQLPANPRAPEGMPSFAGTSWGEMRQYAGIPAQGPVSDDLARELIHGYLACVSYTDANVGRLLVELDRLGLRESTVVVLWGDHGWKLGEHGMWCKHTNFELDTHSALIVSAPGQKAPGRHAAGLTEFVDIYPTLCEVCKLPLPGHLEGSSFAPLLAEPAQAWKPAAFSQYPRTNKGAKLMGYSMRTDRWRYTEWQDTDSGQAVAVEMYDHQADPGEDVNVADEVANAETRRQLAAQFQAGWKAARPGLAAR